MVLLRPGHLHQNSTIRGRPWDVVCRLGPVWINHKKAKINPENTDDKYFQYAATVALIYKKVSGTQTEFQTLNNLQINKIGME